MRLPSLVLAVWLAIFSTMAISLAQDAPTALDYALDDGTELTLEPTGDEKRWTLDLRHYGSPIEGQDLFFSGDLNFIGDDAYECRYEFEGKVQRVHIERTPTAGQPVQLTSQGLKAEGGKPVQIEGLFLPLTSPQRLQRARARFAKADAALNAQYAATRAEVGKAGVTKLRALQRDWIGHRDYRAEWGDHQGVPVEELTSYWEIMLSQTVERIAFLRIYSGVGQPKGITGQYRDAYGGTLELEQTKEGLKFTVEVVRGPTSHEGSLAGVAKLQGDKATYKERVEKGEDRAPAELFFSFREGHIVEVTGKNTSYHHGARASFDGEYYKAGKLEKPIDVE